MYQIMEAAQLSPVCPLCRYENECECQLLLKEMLERLNKVSGASPWIWVDS